MPLSSPWTVHFTYLARRKHIHTFQMNHWAFRENHNNKSPAEFSANKTELNVSQDCRSLSIRV